MVEEASSPSAPNQMPIFALLMHCLVALGSEASNHLSTDPSHILALEVLISMLRDNTIADEFPDHVVPSRRHRSLLAAAEKTLSAVQPPLRHAEVQPTSALASSSSDDASRTVLSDEWVFNGSHCTALGSSPVTVHFWLDQLIHELQGQGITCGIHQGRIMRRLLRDPLRSELLRRISQMPAIDDAVKHREATLSDHYALALVSCCQADDVLRCHREATNPQRRHGEALNTATARAENAARAIATLGCPLAPATQYWALHGLLSSAERIAFTSQPGIHDRFIRQLYEAPEAATARC